MKVVVDAEQPDLDGEQLAAYPRMAPAKQLGSPSRKLPIVVAGVSWISGFLVAFNVAYSSYYSDNSRSGASHDAVLHAWAIGLLGTFAIQV